MCISDVNEGSDANVVTDDTDVLVLLMYVPLEAEHCKFIFSLILRLLMDQDMTSEQDGEAGIRLFVILSGGLICVSDMQNIWK